MLSISFNQYHSSIRLRVVFMRMGGHHHDRWHRIGRSGHAWTRLSTGYCQWLGHNCWQLESSGYVNHSFFFFWLVFKQRYSLQTNGSQPGMAPALVWRSTQKAARGYNSLLKCYGQRGDFLKVEKWILDWKFGLISAFFYFFWQKNEIPGDRVLSWTSTVPSKQQHLRMRRMKARGVDPDMYSFLVWKKRVLSNAQRYGTEASCLFRVHLPYLACLDLFDVYMIWIDEGSLLRIFFWVGWEVRKGNMSAHSPHGSFSLECGRAFMGYLWLFDIIWFCVFI